MQTILQTPTPNLAQSLHFYQQLNFQLLPTNSKIITDGQVNILINPDRFARLGILLYQEDWSKTITELRKQYTLIERTNGYLLSDPSGVQVQLMKVGSCPHLFFNPSLTYFNGANNLAIIELIKALQIPITEEITYFNKEEIVDNIIIRDPGGLGFFLFND